MQPNQCASVDPSMQSNIETQPQERDPFSVIVAALSRLRQTKMLEQLADRIANQPDRSPVVYCQVSDGACGVDELEIDLAALFTAYGPEHVAGLAANFSAWLQTHARKEGVQALHRARDVILAEIESAELAQTLDENYDHLEAGEDEDQL